MRVARKNSIPKVAPSGHHTSLPALAAVLWLILTGIFGISCSPKIIRVPVSPEDIMRANELANEGDLAFERKDIYAALIKYLEAARLNPYSEYLYNRLGISYSQLKF